MTFPSTAARGRLFVAIMTMIAYANSFAGAFVLDDVHEIAANPALERLLPPWEAMFIGNRLPARPLPYLTFAIDRAAWGPMPFGFHVTNLVIHLIAAVALFDLVQTTLSTPALRGRFGGRAVPLAAVIAAMWGVHPLQTQAVTYVYQRIESLAGMCSLLSLACFARAAAAGWSRGWLAASVVAVAGAMASKESTAVLPLTILVWDWFFAPRRDPAAGFRGWMRDALSRRGYYLGLAACWLLVAGQVIIQRNRYAELAEAKHGVLAYALTQPEVILHYLRLSVCPVGQCIDYQWPIATGLYRIAPPTAIVLAAAAITAWGTARRRPCASLAAWFFLGLVVTSSVFPLEAVANEHRMYQPLAAVVAALVVAATVAGDAAVGLGWLDRSGTRRLHALMTTTVLAGLILLTLLRNSFYTSGERMWLSVYDRDPQNLRANWFLAAAFDRAGEDRLADEFASRVLSISPTEYVFSMMAAVHSQAGDYAGAERLCRRALELQEPRLGREHPAVLRTIGDLLLALVMQGNTGDSRRLAEESIEAMRRRLGAEHEVTLAIEGLIGEAALHDGNPASGVPRLRALVETSRRRHGATHAVTTNLTVLLARALRDSGDASAAVALLQATRKEVVSGGPRTAGLVRMIDDVLAGTLQAAGGPAEGVRGGDDARP